RIVLFGFVNCTHSTFTDETNNSVSANTGYSLSDFIRCRPGKDRRKVTEVVGFGNCIQTQFEQTSRAATIQCSTRWQWSITFLAASGTSHFLPRAADIPTRRRALDHSVVAVPALS